MEFAKVSPKYLIGLILTFTSFISKECTTLACHDNLAAHPSHKRTGHFCISTFLI